MHSIINNMADKNCQSVLISILKSKVGYIIDDHLIADMLRKEKLKLNLWYEHGGDGSNFIELHWCFNVSTHHALTRRSNGILFCHFYPLPVDHNLMGYIKKQIDNGSLNHRDIKRCGRKSWGEIVKACELT